MDLMLIGGQRTRLPQPQGQLAGQHEQQQSHQNTHDFHTVRVALNLYKKIGTAPFLASVFGLQTCASKRLSVKASGLLDAPAASGSSLQPENR
jgi:hypothetical protein